MILNMSGGAGGASLNFDVKAYASEAALPATAKENTVAVITYTAITSYIFSATEPENPADGMVWIFTGTSSVAAFNALEKNGIQVYPISAKQYVNGAWVGKVARSYQGGEWISWVLYLLSNGNLHENVTGGWEVASGYTFTKQSDGTFYLSRTSTGAYNPVNTVNRIDVTGYNTIIVALKSSTKAGTTTLIVNDNLTANSSTTGAEEFRLDISALTGEASIALTTAQGHSAYVKEVRLET